MASAIRRSLSLVVALSVAGLALAACGVRSTQKVAEEEKVVVKAMGYGDGSNVEGQSWRRIVDDFEKANPDVDIQDELLYDEAYHQKVIARLASGDIPDIAYMGADARWGAPWEEAGQQYDMRSLIDPNYYDLSLIPPMGPDGEVYEIPIGTANLCAVLFMNEALVRELGFSPPETYADLVRMVPAARARGIEVLGTYGADAWVWGSCFLSCFIARTSGDPHWVTKAKKGAVSFTDPEFVDALAILQAMARDGVLSPTSVLIDDGTAFANYAAGKVLFMVTGQWDASKIQGAALAHTRLLPFPTLPGERGCPGSVAGAIQVGYGLTASGAANPRVRSAAMRFLTYLNNGAEVTRRLRDGTIVAPILRGYRVPDDLPPVIKAKAALGMNSPMVTDVIDALIGGAQNEAINEGCRQIVTGAATPREIAKRVEALRRPTGP